jgi:NADH-quinone oxidoreductase subunit L
MFSMLGIVLANNFVMMFIFWELVGVSSYPADRPLVPSRQRRRRSEQGVPHHRIGDFGFMLGILMIWAATGSVVFSDVAGKMGTITCASRAFLTAAALLIFCGAAGKSAQFPLHVWLPDAMEGPTPISALIHAARWSRPAFTCSSVWRF